jgi:hypothetical protein
MWQIAIFSGSRNLVSRSKTFRKAALFALSTLRTHSPFLNPKSFNKSQPTGPQYRSKVVVVTGDGSADDCMVTAAVLSASGRLQYSMSSFYTPLARQELYKLFMMSSTSHSYSTLTNLHRLSIKSVFTHSYLIKTGWQN